MFTRYITDPGRAALFTVGVRGGGLKQLTPWGNGASDADYSPNGKKIVFEAYPNKGCFGEIYTVDSDGQNLTNITDNRYHAGSGDPVWSPKGNKILFTEANAFSGGFGFDLATMNPDGSAALHLAQPHHQPRGAYAPSRLGVGSVDSSR